MKKHLSIFAIVFSILLVGCNREHIDGRSITSYSIETNSEADREAIVNDFVTFLGDSGLKKAASPGTDTSGFKTLGENTELWKSASAPYTITISKNPNPKYLSGDISWFQCGLDETRERNSTVSTEGCRLVQDAARCDS